MKKGKTLDEWFEEIGKLPLDVQTCIYKTAIGDSGGIVYFSMEQIKLMEQYPQYFDLNKENGKKS